MGIRPDPSCYPSAKLAMQAPVENYAYTVMLSPGGSQPDGIAVVDLKAGSKTYGRIVHKVIMPNTGDEFHHSGWNACSSALSPLAGHAFLERRYLIVPGMHPARLALWSFLAALAHGAGLMLVPIYLQICAIAPTDAGHPAAQSPMPANLSQAVLVALAHTLAMSLAGGSAAVPVYFWLGLSSISRSWFKLDRLWPLSLILIGALGIYAAV